MGFNNLIRHALDTVAGNCLLVPFGFTVNGTSDADGLSGTLQSAVYAEAGEYLCTIKSELGVPYKCIYACVGVSTTADDVDMYGRVDWSTVATDGTFRVFFQTGATQTTPTDNLLVGGLLFLELDDRGP